MASTLSDIGSMTISVSTLVSIALTGALAAGVYLLAQNKGDNKAAHGAGGVSSSGKKSKTKNKRAGGTTGGSTLAETKGASTLTASTSNPTSSNTSSGKKPPTDATTPEESSKKKKSSKKQATPATTAASAEPSYAEVVASESSTTSSEVKSAAPHKAPTSFAEAAAVGGEETSSNPWNKTKSTEAVATDGSFAAVAVAGSAPATSGNKKNKQPGVSGISAAVKHHDAKPSFQVADPALKDMRDEQHDPIVKVARVLKVVGGSIGARPVEEDRWEDEDAAQYQEDDAWVVAGSKSEFTKSLPNDSRGYKADTSCLGSSTEPTKSTFSTAGTSSGAAAFSTSNPAPSAPKTVPGLTASAQAAMTKKQRENQAKAAKAAAVKDAAEQERLERLAAHRKQLERTRMLEQDAQRNKGKKSGIRSVSYPTNGPGSGPAKLQSGGMYASLDNDGKLIWE